MGRVRSGGMKLVANLTYRERNHLISELEIEHRVEIVAAAKIQRQIRELSKALEARHERIREIEDGINLLR